MNAEHGEENVQVKAHLLFRAFAICFCMAKAHLLFAFVWHHPSKI